MIRSKFANAVDLKGTDRKRTPLLRGWMSVFEYNTTEAWGSFTLAVLSMLYKKNLTNTSKLSIRVFNVIPHPFISFYQYQARWNARHRYCQAIFHFSTPKHHMRKIPTWQRFVCVMFQLLYLKWTYSLLDLCMYSLLWTYPQNFLKVKLIFFYIKHLTKLLGYSLIRCIFKRARIAAQRISDDFFLVDLNKLNLTASLKKQLRDLDVHITSLQWQCCFLIFIILFMWL